MKTMMRPARPGVSTATELHTSGVDSSILSNGDDRTDPDFAYVSIMGSDGELKC